MVVAFLPISFNLYQVRIADILLPTAVIFGWPAVVGLALGAGVANIFGGLGPADVVGGSFANFLAAFLAWKIGAHPFRTSGWMSWILLTIGTGTLVPVILGEFVGLGYSIVLWLLVSAVYAYYVRRTGWTRKQKINWVLATVAETLVVSAIVGGNLAVLFSVPLGVAILGVLLGSVVAINFGGYLLLRIIAQPGTLAALRAWGLNLGPVSEDSRNP